jgi:hypothetical protein
MAQIRLTQLDGSLPNLALMKLSHYFQTKGHKVVMTRNIYRSLYEPEYDQVYGSAIFRFSRPRFDEFMRQWPFAVVGGTGVSDPITVEQVIGGEYEHYDYSGWPDFNESLGFTQRGCRLKCKFCVVPQKEGKPRSVNTIPDIWRGAPWPRKLHLLDNDFFGQPKQQWQARIREIRDGGFRVCLSQGINVRRIDGESAAALASIEYRDTKFKQRRLYTAWDNLGDEAVFFSGVKTLAEAGVPPSHLRAYMLVGFDTAETWDRIWHRFNRMVQLGIEPYPMVYDRENKNLLAFQRWVVMGLYRRFPFDVYDDARKSPDSVEAFRKRGWHRGPINP